MWSLLVFDIDNYNYNFYTLFFVFPSGTDTSRTIALPNSLCLMWSPV